MISLIKINKSFLERAIMLEKKDQDSSNLAPIKACKTRNKRRRVCAELTELKTADTGLRKE